MQPRIAPSLIILSALFAGGCGGASHDEPSTTAKIETIRIHVDGFKKSKSGAT